MGGDISQTPGPMALLDCRDPSDIDRYIYPGYYTARAYGKVIR